MIHTYCTYLKQILNTNLKHTLEKYKVIIKYKRSITCVNYSQGKGKPVQTLFIHNLFVRQIGKINKR